MTVLPVVFREMAVLARRKSTYVGRAASAFASLLVMGWLLVMSAAQISASSQGQAVFLVLSSIAFAYAILIGTASTSDCISEEKREGTLGLLFLTDLRPLDVVLGKLSASSLNSVFALLGMLPTMALALLLGGVGYGDILRAALVLLSTMLLSLSVGVLVSTFSSNERKAVLGAFGIMFLLVIVPFLISLFLYEIPVESLVWPSPLYSFLVLHNKGPGFSGAWFAISVGLQGVLSVLFLFLSTRFIQLFVNSAPRKTTSRLREKSDQIVYGSKIARAGYRRRLLNINPFLWLASRERHKPAYAWLVVLFFAALYLWIYFQFNHRTVDLPTTGAVVFLTHFILKTWATSEVCSRLIEDRRGGALELLLTTPLSVPEIARGQSLALRRIFGAPIVVIVAAELYLLRSGAQSGTGAATSLDFIYFFVGAIASLLLDLWALKWVALWNSLFGKSIERVLLSTIVKVLAAPMAVYAVFAAMVAVYEAAWNLDVRSHQMLAALFTTGFLFSVVLGTTARTSFLRHFREAAADRFTARPVLRSSLATCLKDALNRFSSIGRIVQAVPRPLRQHWILSSLALAFTILLASGFLHGLYWNWQSRAEIARIKGDGQPLGGAELSKYYTPIPARENILEAIRKAGPPFGVSPNSGKSYAGEPLGEEEKARFLAILEKNQPQLLSLFSATNYQRAYVKPDFFSGWTVVRDMYQYIPLVSAELDVAISEGDSPRIERSLNLLLHLATAFRREPVFELQLLSARFLDLYARGIERTIAEGRFKTQWLARSKEKLSEFQTIEPLPRILVIQRALLQDPIFPGSQFTGPERNLFLLASGLARMSGYMDRRNYSLLSAFREASDVSTLPPAERDRAILGLRENAKPNPSDLAVVFSFDTYRFLWNQCFSGEAAIQARVRTLQAGLAAYKYWQCHRRFSSGLAELTESFATNIVTIDPFTGNSLCFAPDMNSLHIYSFGYNFRDDRGTPAKSMNNADIAFSLYLPGEAEPETAE